MNTGKYVFGYPDTSLLEDAENSGGAIILGGCEIPSYLEPHYHCHDCRKDFGGFPQYRLKGKQREFGDCVLGATKISFEVNGYPDSCGLAVEITPNSLHLESPESYYSMSCAKKDIDITPKVFHDLVRRLFLKLYIADWKREHGRRDVIDGNYWNITIELHNARSPISICGVEAYPPYYKRFLNLIRPLFLKHGLLFWGDTPSILQRAPQWDSCKTISDVVHEAAQLALDEYNAGVFSAKASGFAFDFSWAMKNLRTDRVLHYLRQARKKASSREIIDEYLWRLCYDLILKRDNSDGLAGQ